MYDFEKLLYPDEKILYKGKPTPGKGHKNVGILLFLLVFLGLALFLMIISFKNEGIDPKEIMMVFTILIFCGFIIYGLIYNLFIKKRAVEDDEYCLTNQRAFKYEAKKEKLIFGYLSNYRTVEAVNVKNNYGDVKMEMIYKNGNNTDLTKEDLVELKNLMFNPNEENMPYITFESVENPEAIVKLIFDAKKELREK